MELQIIIGIGIGIFAFILLIRKGITFCSSADSAKSENNFVDKNTFFSKFSLFSAIIIIIALHAGYIIGTAHTNKVAPAVVTETPSSSLVGEVMYIAQSISKNCDSDFSSACDFRIVKINEDGSSEVIVENIVELFVTQTQVSRERIHPFNLAGINSKLIFETVIGSSKCCDLYAFDLTTKKFTRLVNYRNSDIVNDTPSPDKSRILHMDPNGKRLYVTNVFTDINTDLVLLPEHETLISSYSGYGNDPLGTYEWLGNDTIAYKVYAPRDGVGTDESTPIDERIIHLN